MPDFFDKHEEVLSYFAPGRINIIGEHLDYNGGLVFPGAISLGIRGQIQYRADSTVKLSSIGFPGLKVFDLSDELSYDSDCGWGNFPRGVIKYLSDSGRGPGRGFNILFDSNLPPASGLSSSAAMEVLTAYMLIHRSIENESDMVDMALLAQRVENEYIGVRCGIMDQFTVALARAGHAILLDSGTLGYRHVPLDLKDHAFVIMNTRRPRALAGSKYNERREECARALRIIKRKKKIQSLADGDMKDLPLLPDGIIKKRARHVITENRRVLDSVKALERGDIVSFGDLLTRSHASLKDDFEVTGPELDAMVDAALGSTGCIGARMTGAGFGGCAIALVEKGHLEGFINDVGRAYSSASGLAGEFYVSELCGGVHQIIR